MLLFLVSFEANAQKDSLSSKLQFKLSANYNTSLNYYGRADGLTSSGFFPLAELWPTPGFYINAAPVFVTNKLKHFNYAGTVATVGYQNAGTKWISSIYAAKPFYKQASELVQSSLKAQGGASLTYQNKIVNIIVGSDAKWSDKMDYGASAGLNHIIRIENKDKSVLVFDPSVDAYAGTQNFQRTYNERKNAGFLLFPEMARQVTKQVSQFKVLAYEASMPIIYSQGKVMLIATPSYILPQNLIIDSGNPDASGRGESMFCATLTAKYAF